MQFTVPGNSFTLYQVIGGIGSRNVRICVVGGSSTDTTLSCTTISQRSSIGRYAVPVTIYGLGPGSHNIIVENRDHGAWMYIEGVEVHK